MTDQRRELESIHRIGFLEGVLERLVVDVRALHEPAGNLVELEHAHDTPDGCDRWDPNDPIAECPGHVESVLVCETCTPAEHLTGDEEGWVTPWPCPTWLATQDVLDHRRHYTVTLTIADESGTVVATGSQRLSIDADQDPVRAVAELGGIAGGLLAGQQDRAPNRRHLGNR